MRSSILAIIILASCMAYGQATPSVPVDPCSSNTPKSSFSVSITTATTTAVVAVSGNTTVYVCSFLLDMVATVAADTVQFEYGTGTTCAGSPTALTGVMSSGILANGAVVISSPASNSTQLKTPAANGLCIVSTVGTGPSIAGFVTYVQQ